MTIRGTIVGLDPTGHCATLQRDDRSATMRVPKGLLRGLPIGTRVRLKIVRGTDARELVAELQAIVEPPLRQLPYIERAWPSLGSPRRVVR